MLQLARAICCVFFVMRKAGRKQMFGDERVKSFVPFSSHTLLVNFVLASTPREGECMLPRT